MNKKQIVVVSLAIACCLAADSMLYIALPIYWKEAGLSSLWEVGVLLSINRFIRLPLNPFIGFLYSKIEIKTGLLIATFLAVIANLGYALGGRFWLWILFRSIWGVAWALFSLGGLLTVIKCAEENNRGQLMGTYNGLYRLGSLVGMLLGGILPVFISFGKTALFFGGLSLFSFVFVFFMEKVGEGERVPQKPIVIKDLWLRPVLMVLASGFIINMLYRGVINSTLSLIITENFGLEIKVLNIVVGSTALAGILQAARWVWEPFLATRIGQWSDGIRGRVPLLIGSLLIAALSFTLTTLKVPLIIWIGVICLVMLCATSLTTLMDALASDVAKSTGPVSVMTSYTIANDLGAAIGPVLIYQLINLNDGIVMGLIGSALILVILAITWYQNNKRDLAQT